ncbi:non-ribosomal peptide synthetase [Corallococcus macrosporus]|uniref:Non-ribosomal peptide synthetase n=1 Tax=Myxococcus fulvus (strain ATCC BAA-855 / HW-1) TaxID=483219 RepID=F8CAU0_MYXFH|nr:non-ribosomal peptide synthetase [Corallococcus macrosporus]
MGLCVERSLELVVSVLGILKAGGVYVPLDASYPLERLSWMKAEAGVAVLVAQEKLADEVASGGELVVCVDTEWATQIAHQPETTPSTRVCGDNLAYVMLESSSTGTARRRTRRSPARTGWRVRRRWARRCPSAGLCPIRRHTCWTTQCGRCRWVCPVSCTWAETAWQWATWAALS